MRKEVEIAFNKVGYYLVNDNDKCLSLRNVTGFEHQYVTMIFFDKESKKTNIETVVKNKKNGTRNVMRSYISPKVLKYMVIQCKDMGWYDE